METYYKKKRKKVGLAPSDMAKELGINCKKYSLIENGVVKMPKNLIDKFNKIVNKGKNENVLERLNNEQIVNDFWNDMKTKTDGKYNLKKKMAEFNIDTFRELAKLVGVSNSNISHYLNADWEAPYDFKNAMYLFFQDELNIQAPKKKSTSSLKGKKGNNQVGRARKDPVLVDWYRTTDLIKLANENNVTYEDISIGSGVNLSSVSRAMRKSTNTPSYNTLKCLKDYFDNLTGANTNYYQVEPVVEPEYTTTVASTNFDEFVLPELEKCDEEPTEHVEKCDEEEDIRRRYQTEIEENNVIIETYQGIIDRLTMRNKVCEEVLKVIDELRGE